MKKLKKIQRQYNYYYYKLRKLKKEGLIPKELKEESFEIIKNKKDLNDVKQSDINRLQFLTSPQKRLRKYTRGKTKTAERRQLKAEFKTALQKLKDYQLEKEAINSLMGKPKSANLMGESTFRKLNFTFIYEQGVYRRDKDGNIILLKGFEAVKEQIKSIERQTNPEWRKSLFIESYIDQLSQVIDDSDTIEYIRGVLEDLEPRQITWLLNNGYIPEISFFYIITPEDITAMVDKFTYIDKTSNWEQAYNNMFKDLEEEKKRLEEWHKIEEERRKNNNKYKPVRFKK